MSVRALLALGLSAAAAAEPPASIVRLELGPEDQETRPVAIPTETAGTVEVDFPAALAEWAGRGFTPDPEKFAGDFALEATRGRPRCFVTPLTVGAHRVLHVVLDLGGGRERSLTLEFLPAPAGLAWTKVSFVERAAQAAAPVRLLPTAPGASIRAASPEAELGLLRTLRLFGNASADEAAALAAANPALEFALQDGAARSCGAFAIALHFALRDRTTGSLGLALSVSNLSTRRLFLDPGSWMVRAGDHVYPAATVDANPALEPGSTTPAFLVLSRGPDGEDLRLRPDQPFRVSAAALGQAAARPVQRLALPELPSS